MLYYFFLSRSACDIEFIPDVGSCVVFDYNRQDDYEGAGLYSCEVSLLARYLAATAVEL